MTVKPFRTPWESIEDLYESWRSGQWESFTLEDRAEVATIWRRLMRIQRAVIPTHLIGLADRVQSHQSTDPSSQHLLGLVSELLGLLEPRTLADRASVRRTSDFTGQSESVYPTLRAHGRRAVPKTPEASKFASNLVRTPEVTQQIFALSAQGLSTAKIAAALQLQGIKISKPTVTKALRRAS